VNREQPDAVIAARCALDVCLSVIAGSCSRRRKYPGDGQAADFARASVEDMEKNPIHTPPARRDSDMRADRERPYIAYRLPAGTASGTK
jgi:hypothetical protein